MMYGSEKPICSDITCTPKLYDDESPTIKPTTAIIFVHVNFTLTLLI